MLRNKSDKPRSSRSAERRQSEQDASDTLRARAIPPRQPRDVDGIETRAAQSRKKDGNQGDFQRRGGDQQSRPCCRQAQSAEHDFSFGEPRQEQRRGSSPGREARIEEHRRQRGHSRDSVRQPLGILGGPNSDTRFRSYVDKK